MSPARRRPALDEHIDSRLLHERVLYRNGRPALTVTFKSSAVTSNGQPVFFNEDVVQATVNVLDGRQVEKITFKGKGFLVSPDIGIEKVFWSAAEVHYTSVSLTPLFQRLIRRSVKVYDDNDCWNFSLQLPARVAVRTRRGTMHCPLPPTYRSTVGAGRLEYEFSVTAHRGVLRDSYRLKIPFIYLPRCTPEHPLWSTTSVQVDNHPEVEEGFVEISPIGPRRIPGGSFGTLSFEERPNCMEQQSIQGVVFGNRRVLVTLRALYNSPPIFARDAPIRISLSFESQDAQVLDLLTSESCLQAHVEQRARFECGQVYTEVICRGSTYWDRPPAATRRTASRPLQRKAELSFECPRDACPSFRFPDLTLQHWAVIQIKPGGFFVPVTKPIPPLRLEIQIVTDSVLA